MLGNISAYNFLTIENYIVPSYNTLYKSIYIYIEEMAKKPKSFATQNNEDLKMKNKAIIKLGYINTTKESVIIWKWCFNQM